MVDSIKRGLSTWNTNAQKVNSKKYINPKSCAIFVIDVQKYFFPHTPTVNRLNNF